MYEENLENKYKIVELISQIKKENLNINTEEELFYIIDIIIGFIMHGLIDLFMDKEKEERVKEKLDKQLEILKRGIYKED